LLRALTKAGNYVSGAYDGTELVGACVGFFGAPVQGSLHSHIAGVSEAVQGRAIGFALKLHQRQWALRRGVREICWTFDPLVRRNAYFNVVKLAATPAEYLRNFYGDVHDGINGADDTDRLLVSWSLTDPAVEAACRGAGHGADASTERATGAAVAVDIADDGGPVIGSGDASIVLVAVPADIEPLRQSDPAMAGRWRHAVREALGGLMSDGARVTGFDRAGWYVLDRRKDQ
jgi:predicted GNAT superfamily acetyltransferase